MATESAVPEDALALEDTPTQGTPQGATPLTGPERARRQATIKKHWAEHAVTSGFDAPPEDKQVKGPARKK